MNIKQIRTQYDFNQETFAKILNWGVATVKRYESGNSIPDSTHIVILKILRTNPETIAKFYNETKNNFSEEEHKQIEANFKIYEEFHPVENIKELSYRFIEEMYKPHEGSIESGYSYFNSQKLIHMILFFTRKGVQKTKLMKLLWYSDFLMFKRNLVSISGTPYYHRKHGPVPKNHDTLLGHLEDTLQLITISEEIIGNGYTLNLVQARREWDESLFDEDEWNILSYIDEFFQSIGSVEISDRSHKEEGWRQTTEYEIITYNFADSLSLD